MKILLFLICCLSLSLFAANSIPYSKKINWKKGEINLADINKEIELQKDAKIKIRYGYLILAKYFIEKGFPQITYSEYKNMFEEATKDINFGKTFFKMKVFIENPIVKVNYKNLYKSMILDPGITINFKLRLIFGLGFNFKDLSASEFVKVINEIVIPQMQKNPKKYLTSVNCLKVLNGLKHVRFNIQISEYKLLLQKLKMLTYPKIDQGSDWKKLAVEIELLLKSVE